MTNPKKSTKPAQRKSDLPFGSEFSPTQINLPDVLQIAKTNNEGPKKFEQILLDRYFFANQTTRKNRDKLAYNCRLAMTAYGIIDQDAKLTKLGEKLFALKDDEKSLYTELGKHILLNLNGVNLVQCILDMQMSGESVTLPNLRRWLDERGIHFPSGGKHPSIMRLWLERAGVFCSRWRVDESKFAKLIQANTDELEIISAFTQEQKAYIKTLANLDGTGPFLSNEVQRIASATYGTKFDEKNLPKQVLYPIKEAGLINLERGTKKPGRGAKPFLVTLTDKFKAEILSPLIQQIEKQVQVDLRPMLRKNLSNIINDLDSTDKYVRGLALEALAFKILRLVDMTYVATRLRGTATGGAEVDLIFQSDRLVFSRWQIQCKNTSRVSLDDVAKEVGITHFLMSNVVVMITTGTIGPEARKYANKIMSTSNLCVVMIDGNDVRTIVDSQSYIVDVFNREARTAMKLKNLEL